MAQAQFTKSEIFSWFNRARSAARKGNGGLEIKRTNRALGYLLSGKAQEHWGKYGTTLRSCGCPDREHNRNIPCKGMVAKMIASRIESHRPQPETMTVRALMRSYDPVSVLNSQNPQEIFERLICGVETPNGPMNANWPATEWLVDTVSSGWTATGATLLSKQGSRAGFAGYFEITLER